MAQFENPSILTSRCGSTTGERVRMVVWVAGEHDVATAASLTAAIARAGQCENADLLIDLSGVTFMDASTLGAIVDGANRLATRGQSLEVRAPSRRALLVLKLCGLTHLIQRDAAHPSGGAAALGTWVGVPPIEVEERLDHEVAPATVGAAMRQPDGPAPADFDVREDYITAAADRGGP